MALEYEINRPASNVFRRCYIKRRSNTTGLYEASWHEVTDFVKSWGTFRRSVDDIRFNKFTHSGVSLTMRNDTGAFNREDNESSLWYGYLTRYKTLVKIEGGYASDDGTEYPTDSSLGVFVLSDEVQMNAADNEAVISCRSLVSIFDDVRAVDIPGMSATLTADAIIAKVKDHTDGSSNFIFRQFITSTAWTIQSTTANYNISTDTSLGDMSCWELMEKIAESENFLLLINRTGGFEFRNRTERTTTSQFAFYGLGFPIMNIIEIMDFKEAINNYFNYFRIKWRKEDTSTSYVAAGTVTTVNPSNTSWKYGSRRYEFENEFFASTATAQSVVDMLLGANAQTRVRNECALKTKFIPHLEISDKVAVSYFSTSIGPDTPLWDLVDWNAFDWAASGDIFNLNQEEFKITSISTDLNKFTTTFVLREI